MFQNLRASRATDLANEYPAHVAAAWLGYSVIVANKHYWQVTDGDFEAAARGNVAASNDASEKATQKATHAMHGTGRNGKKPDLEAQQKTPDIPGFSETCASLRDAGMGNTGLEPVRQTREIVGVSTEAAQNAAHAAHGAAQSGGHSSDSATVNSGPVRGPQAGPSKPTSKAAATIPIEAAGTPIEASIGTPTEANSDSGIDLSIDKPIDADLTRVVEAWPALPDAIRAGILAMIRAASC